MICCCCCCCCMCVYFFWCMSDSFSVGVCVCMVGVLRYFGTLGFIFTKVFVQSETLKSPAQLWYKFHIFYMWIVLTNQPIAEKTSVATISTNQREYTKGRNFVRKRRRRRRKEWQTPLSPSILITSCLLTAPASTSWVTHVLFVATPMNWEYMCTVCGHYNVLCFLWPLLYELEEHMCTVCGHY